MNNEKCWKICTSLGSNQSCKLHLLFGEGADCGLQRVMGINCTGEMTPSERQSYSARQMTETREPNLNASCGEVQRGQHDKD